MSNLHPIFSEIFGAHFEGLNPVKAAQDSDQLEQFRKACSMASFHFADDSCREWGHAYKYQAEAQRIFDAASPEAKDAMWKLKGQYMVSLKDTRKTEG